MSRTGHQGHYEACPHCGERIKTTNWSRRYVSPDSRIVPAVHLRMGLGNFSDTAIKRTTIHRIGCAKKHGKTAYES